ncbi:amidohydrolase family protein [Paludisphaera mucosa]|uniref:Amidohydrolase family protein n=1 Tax=Paludisphaera mucosa TaxID=3030827 RepID=A0ABT6F5P5_9BACT|nr:amidohydrolase family protein [Paludisphaera mucosa]MDG3002898.1 amidohydrolase family protein [Paludisphaera mucosa]
MAPNRREFLGWTAAAALSAGADAPVSYVDSHVHIWDLDRLRPPWLAGDPQLDHNARWSEYQKASAGVNVVKAVYLEVDVAPHQHEQEARLAIELCRDPSNAITGAVIGGRPAAEDFAAYIEPLAKDPAVKGLRQVLHGATPAGYCLQPRFVDGIRKLGSLGLSFDLCMRHADLPDAAKLVETVPDTAFILDHCGNPPLFGDLTAWKRDVDRIAARPNVVGKVSGIIASVKGRTWHSDDLAPVIRHMLEAFGPDRVLFGGDWPVCTLGAPLQTWITTLAQVVKHIPAENRRKLYHDNAIRVYRLT